MKRTEDSTSEYRKRIWAELATVARPDSRFHWDFSSFIADFKGSEECARRILSLDSYRVGGAVFITPDNSTEALRATVIADERPVLMTTYGIGRGFLLLGAGSVPSGQEPYAATLDGMDRLARPVTLGEIASGERLRLLVTGGSAVSANGIRFGKGHGYFDLEWAMLSEIGAVDAATEIVCVVHDCQVVDEPLTGADHDVAVDWIITPTRSIHVTAPGRKLGQVRWEMLEHSPLAQIPPIRELQAGIRTPRPQARLPMRSDST